MAQTQTSSFTVADWDEQEIAGAAHAMRHTVTHYAASYFGEVSGTSTFDLVMVYRPDGTVPYTGYEFFEGTIGQRSGTVVFEHRGVYEGEGASSELSVVPGTATGSLADVTITGRWFAPSAGDGTLMVEVREDEG